MFQWFGLVNFSPYTKVGDFAQHLKDGRVMASKCKSCGDLAFPPRADCEKCMSGDFELTEISGKATLHTFTKIVAAPAGATAADGVWYAADGTEIGPVIWGAFATIVSSAERH